MNRGEMVNNKNYNNLFYCPRILFLILICTSVTVLPCQEPDQPSGQPHSSGLALSSTYWQKIKVFIRPACRFVRDITATSCRVAIDIATAYCVLMSTVIAHELGHGLTSKLFGGPLDITIGRCETSPFVSIGGIKFCGFSPHGVTMIAVSNFSYPELATILMAGPICGACFNVLAAKLINKLPHNTISRPVNWLYFVAEIGNFYPHDESDGANLLKLWASYREYCYQPLATLPHVTCWEQMGCKLLNQTNAKNE